MPRNGSGVYNLPTGINPVTPNTPITSSWANTTLGDIASALSQSLARDGQTTPIANLPMGGFRHTNVSNPSARNQYASLGWVQDGFHIRATSVGGTNAISAQLLGGATALQTGQMIQLTPVNTNTGAVTLDINSIGAKQVVRINGLQFASGQFVAGTPYVLIYDGTKFICLNAPVDSGSAPATIGPSTGNTVSGGTHTHNLDLAANYTWTGNHTFNGTLSGNLSGNATTATSATTADSATSATTATRLATARNFTIGGTSRSFNGSANVSWSLSDIGAAPTSHTHTIANVTGLQSALDGKAATSHTHSASQVTSGKFDVARIPHLSGNESTGWARLNSDSANPDTMGSIRLTTGGNSFVYTFNGAIRFTCSSAGNMSVTGAISDSVGPVRRAKHRTANGSGNLNADLDLNGIIEKTNTAAVTYTIPSGFGSPGDIVTVINSGSSGAITIARASGVSLYRNGTNANIVVQPGQMISIVRTATNNRWQA